MKSLFSKFGLRFVVFQLGSLLCQSASAAVVFTVAPSLVTNTYTGPITLQVTGLTNGATVMLQRYVDVNGNGVIDNGDLLWEQFNLTDGHAGMVIGGVTNINVPGDTDTVAGQITAKLKFQIDFSPAIVGKYLYKLSSPSGEFAPKTNSFTITNFPYPQKFTGTILSNGVAVPNAVAILFQSSGGNDLNAVGGAVANNSGGYTIAAPAGTYTLLPVKVGLVANEEGAANLVLGSGATVDTNLSLIATAQTISGIIVDANDSALGLPGLLMTVESTNDLLGVFFSSAAGNFSAGVNPGQWKIAPDSGGLALLGYLDSQNKQKIDTSAGSVMGVAINLPKATALFYGTVEDNLGNPFPGVDIYSADDNGNYEADSTTDTNGSYVTAALGGLGSNDLWQVEFGSASLFPNDDFSQPSFDQIGGTNLAVGQAVLANFAAILATNYITGNVQFNGNPVSGVQVYASSQDANNFQSQATTDTNGNYSLPVGNDSWYVNVDCQGGNNTLDGILGPGNYQCPCGVTVTISSNNGTANFTVGGGGSGQISGYVTNASGSPIVGVSVSGSSCNGGYSSDTTDNNGFYALDVANGTWNVNVDCGGLSALGYQCVNTVNVTVSSANVQQNFTVQSVNSGGGPLQINTTVLPAGMVGNSYSQQLNASGGQPPYTWSVTPGSLPLPSGLSLSTNGLVSGSPGAAAIGTNYFSVRVTDALAASVDQLLSLAIYPTLTISTNALPNGTVGAQYNAQILVSGGDAPGGYSYNVVGSLPPGLNFSFGVLSASSEQFLITGTPTNSGAYPFTFEAYDLNFTEVQANFTITITSSTLQITTASLRDATAGVNYTNQLQASGGATPYAWTIALGSQPLPSALTLSTNGLISGVPAAVGTNNFIVRVTDANSITVTRTLTLITGPRPGLASEAKSGAQLQFLFNGAIGQNYTVQKSTNLASTNWISLFITNNTVTNSFLVTDPNATNAQGFYRVLIGP